MSVKKANKKRYSNRKREIREENRNDYKFRKNY
jgi:hypothetical protein